MPISYGFGGFNYMRRIGKNIEGMRASGSAATGLGCGNMRSDTGGQILSAFGSFALVVAPLKQALMGITPLAI